jgi:hypothetical protein
VQLARDHDVPPVAIVLDVPGASLHRLNVTSRTDRQFGANASSANRINFCRSMKFLGKEGAIPQSPRAPRRRMRSPRQPSRWSCRLTTSATRQDRRRQLGDIRRFGRELGNTSSLDLRDRAGRLGGRPADAACVEGRKVVFLGDSPTVDPGHPGFPSSRWGKGPQPPCLSRSLESRKQACA